MGLSLNTARPVSYATAGLKDVRVQVSYTDGSTWQSHLQVLAPAPATSSRAARGGATTQGTQGTLSTGYTGIPNLSFNYTADKAYLGQYASAVISVEYSGAVGVLDKPLIIVKGFDVSSILPVAATPFSNIGRFTYGAYMYDTFNKVNAGGELLGNGAYQDGYDIVYVDFDNGVDYIQRNAYLLEKVIKWVNDNKTGSAPNKMMGLSFGGIMAQYALRDIEEAGSVANNPAYPHQVGLLITHDSPSQGANVPLSIQLLVRKLAGTTIRNPVPFSDDVVLTDRFPLLGKARDALLSPASQQLLRYQTTRPLLYSVGGFQYYGEVAAAQTSLYDSFQQEYQAKLGSAHVPVGTPGKPCRVVAVSNGTECGLTQPYGPYALLASLNYEGNYDNFGLLDVLRNVLLASPVGGFAVGLGIVSGPVGIIGVGLVACSH